MSTYTRVAHTLSRALAQGCTRRASHTNSTNAAAVGDAAAAAASSSSSIRRRKTEGESEIVRRWRRQERDDAVVGDASGGTDSRTELIADARGTVDARGWVDKGQR